MNTAQSCETGHGLNENAPSSFPPPVLPRPVDERYGRNVVRLAPPGHRPGLRFEGVRVDSAPPLAQGVRLLKRRLENLGLEGEPAEDRRARILVRRVDPGTLRKSFEEDGLRPPADEEKLAQSYVLRVRPKDGACIEGTADIGLYYAILSLIQLLTNSPERGPIAPETHIRDYPSAPRRLAKTSGTYNDPELVDRFAEWITVYKIRMLGIQFHGEDSRRPDGTFRTNVQQICSRYASERTLETIVYFCPFRGEGAYDFRRPEEREAYIEFLHWILTQGADGIEIDYNDWPGEREVGIDTVINFVCTSLRGTDPTPHILWCPPNQGNVRYFG